LEVLSEEEALALQIDALTQFFEDKKELEIEYQEWLKTHRDEVNEAEETTTLTHYDKLKKFQETFFSGAMEIADNAAQNRYKQYKE